MTNRPAEQFHPVSELDSSKLATARQTKRLQNIALAVAISISSLLPGCVYHRRGTNAPYPFQYEHMDAEVVYPWRVTDEFSQEYEFKILATIVLNLFAFPYEFFKGWEKMDLARVFASPLPGVYHAHENDRDDIARHVERARERRAEQERAARMSQTGASEGR
jgi:hypothetical protein